MLAGVAAIALGLDTGILARFSSGSTGSLEQVLVGKLAGDKSGGAMMAQNSGAMMAQDSGAMKAQDNASGAMMASSAMMMKAVDKQPASLPVEGQLPSLDGAVQWLNSTPLSAAQLKGKVVLVDFWTYSCINCLRTLPYVKAWAEKYHDQGLVVIGVHAPEFAFERDVNNVTKAMRDLGINYPVALDNDYKIWRSFDNQYWPAHYFADAQGRIRYHHFGEGAYAESEQVIQQLLREAGAGQVVSDVIDINGQGVQQAADLRDVRSPETYVGYERAAQFASPGGAQTDRLAQYQLPGKPALNDWGLEGQWNIGSEQASLNSATGKIAYRFHARDLHLVLGPGADGKPVRFMVTVDGKAPGAAHGMDVAPDGSGQVKEQRLYQLVRQPGEVADHTFTIEFLDAGVAAYAFTFG
jgi:thiol-disulfide isomerase/thioredoxin